jgi:transketolase
VSQKKFLEASGEIDRLELLATRVRRSAVEYITRSGSGHPGGSLSIADLLTAVYFGRTYDPATGTWENLLRYDPADPLWSNRDRVILSKGHAAPGWYAVLAEAGFISREAFKIYRKIDCPLEGHPVMYRLQKRDGRTAASGIPGVDFASGSLGHGLSAAAGMALHALVYGYDYRVYAVVGDGDMQEGMTWEALLTIPNKRLVNLCAVYDYNRLQVDGGVDAINQLEPLRAKLEAFNWEVLEIDGHDFCAIIDAFDYFKNRSSSAERPLLIVAHTTKGKGVAEIENDYRYHALPLTLEAYERVEKRFLERISALEERISSRGGIAPAPAVGSKTGPLERTQDLSDIARRNPPSEYSQPTATRVGYGNALARLGEYERLFVLNADLAGACATTRFIERYPEDAAEPRDRRSLNVGVQECNMMTMGAALASCGKIPVVNSFGVFSAGRAWEMVRQDVSYPRLNVKIIGSHTGIALGEYGVTHQAVADVALMRALPHIYVVEPSDAIQADLLFEKIVVHDGPVYLRLGRNPVPLIYGGDNPWGVPPLRGFDLGTGYRIREGGDLTLIASGPIVVQALEVARRARESVRVIDMPTIRPVDEQIIEEAARETGWICTIQDHLENGGLNDAVGRVLLQKGLRVRFDFVALEGFARSGSAADLYEEFGLSAARIIGKLGLHPEEPAAAP